LCWLIGGPECFYCLLETLPEGGSVGLGFFARPFSSLRGFSPFSLAGFPCFLRAPGKFNLHSFCISTTTSKGGSELTPTAFIPCYFVSPVISVGASLFGTVGTLLETLKDSGGLELCKKIV
jgi:hypothetical protein